MLHGQLASRRSARGCSWFGEMSGTGTGTAWQGSRTLTQSAQGLPRKGAGRRGPCERSVPFVAALDLRCAVSPAKLAGTSTVDGDCLPSVVGDALSRLHLSFCIVYGSSVPCSVPCVGRCSGWPCFPESWILCKMCGVCGGHPADALPAWAPPGKCTAATQCAFERPEPRCPLWLFAGGCCCW